MEYIFHILTLIAIYSIVGASLYLLVGCAGLLSLSQAAFYGIGAYAAALLAVNYRVPFPVGLLSAAVTAGLAGAVVGSASLRMRDDFFVLGTFAFQAVTITIANNWVGLTNGPFGIAGITRPTIAANIVSPTIQFLGIAAALAGVAHVIAWRLSTSPFGRVLRAIREDEVFATSLGKRVHRYKVQIFMVAAALAGVAGALYAHYVSFIDPGSFTLAESVFMLSIVIVGGARNLAGCLLGAVVLVSVPEMLRLLDLPSAFVGSLRQVLYGGSLVLFVMFRPAGLVKEKTFRTTGA